MQAGFKHPMQRCMIGRARASHASSRRNTLPSLLPFNGSRRAYSPGTCPCPYTNPHPLPPLAPDSPVEHMSPHYESGGQKHMLFGPQPRRDVCPPKTSVACSGHVHTNRHRTASASRSTCRLRRAPRLRILRSKANGSQRSQID